MSCLLLASFILLLYLKHLCKIEADWLAYWEVLTYSRGGNWKCFNVISVLCTFLCHLGVTQRCPESFSKFTENATLKNLRIDFKNFSYPNTWHLIPFFHKSVEVPLHFHVLFIKNPIYSFFKTRWFLIPSPPPSLQNLAQVHTILPKHQLSGWYYLTQIFYVSCQMLTKIIIIFK